MEDTACPPSWQKCYKNQQPSLSLPQDTHFMGVCAKTLQIHKQVLCRQCPPPFTYFFQSHRSFESGWLVIRQSPGHQSTSLSAWHSSPCCQGTSLQLCKWAQPFCKMHPSPTEGQRSQNRERKKSFVFFSKRWQMPGKWVQAKILKRIVTNTYVYPWSHCEFKQRISRSFVRLLDFVIELEWIRELHHSARLIHNQKNGREL